jgi:hypothetical protein
MATIERRNWLFLCNPKVWDVFRYWEEEGHQQGIDGWTASKYLDKLRKRDDAVFWITGPAAGVYAIGRISTPVYESDAADRDDGYWLQPPSGRVHACDLAMDRYFFDRPIWKAELAADADFADALILRMPGGGSPMPLTDRQFAAVLRHAGVDRPAPGGHSDDDGVELELPIEAERDGIEVTNPPGSHYKSFSEFRLVRDYERFLGRALTRKVFRRADGIRLVTDAWDRDEALLIEAKASSSRESLRTALGQILDYSRFMTEDHTCAVLVPERPTDDMVDLLQQHGVLVIYRDRSGFDWE